MYQVIEMVKPAGDKNYNDRLMENIAEGRYQVVFESDDRKEAEQELLKKQVKNAKTQSGLHHELIEKNGPTPIFVDNYKFYQAIKRNNDD